MTNIARRFLGVMVCVPCFGCSCPSPPPHDPMLAVSSAPSSDGDDKAAALSECANAYAAFAGTAAEHRASAAANIAESCADLYSRSACSQAMKRWSSTPVESRAASIARACRDAYCPSLEEPKPALCLSLDLPAPSELPSQWNELNERVLRLELGDVPRDLSPLARFPFGPSIATPLPEPEPASLSVVIRLSVGAKGEATASIDDGSGVRASAPGSDFSSIANLAASKDPNVYVVIAADSHVTHRDVVLLMDALKQAGVHRITLQVASP